MSCNIPLHTLSEDVKRNLSKDLEVFPKETKYGVGEAVLTFDVFETPDVNTRIVAVPFSYSFKNLLKELPNSSIDFPRASGYTFEGILNSVQNEIKNTTYDILNRTRSILIALYCGCGKTAYTIFLASKLQYKTVILCHRINLIDQWEYSIKKFCPNAKVQVLEGKTEIDNDSDFYIMNVGNVSKRNREDFKHIGILCIDEAHTICTKNLSKSLFYFTPKYLIGLTATPDRTDGMGKILDLYFGEERITRKLFRPFNCYVYNTGFKPKMEQSSTGRLDWNSVLNSQGNDDGRNNLIVDVIRYFRTRNFLVLCKRVDQADSLLKKLKNRGEDVDIFVSTSRKFNRSSRILISTYSKTGVGFDHPKLDALIVASDVEEGIEQYVGRVFRREDVTPIVFDFLDKAHTLFKHFLSRRSLYTSIGGEVKDFVKVFPEFSKWREINMK